VSQQIFRSAGWQRPTLPVPVYIESVKLKNMQDWALVEILQHTGTYRKIPEKKIIPVDKQSLKKAQNN
jgi:hypothetical protein